MAYGLSIRNRIEIFAESMGIGVEEFERQCGLPGGGVCGAGHGRQPGYLRNSLALSNCRSGCSEVEFLIENYKKTWPVSGPSYQVHCRYLLIDAVTGYRSNYKKASFVINM